MVTISKCLEIKYGVKCVAYVRDGVRKSFKNLCDCVLYGVCSDIIEV